MSRVSPAGASALWALPLCLTWVSCSRVHITEATLNHLDKAYEVEDGQGQQRDSYLKEMNIRTYLVIDPRVRGSEAAARGPGGAAQCWERGQQGQYRHTPPTLCW